MALTHPIGTLNGPAFHSGETVYCRFTGESFTVVFCNGCVADLRDSAGNLTGRIVGEITRRAA